MMELSRQRVVVPDPPRLVPKGVFFRRMMCMFLLGVVFTALGVLLGGLATLAVFLACLTFSSNMARSSSCSSSPDSSTHRMLLTASVGDISRNRFPGWM